MQLAIRCRNDGSYLLSFDHAHSRSDTDDECYVSPPSAPLHRCSDLGSCCGKGGGQNMVKVVCKIPAPVFFKLDLLHDQSKAEDRSHSKQGKLCCCSATRLSQRARVPSRLYKKSCSHKGPPPFFRTHYLPCIFLVARTSLL